MGNVSSDVFDGEVCACKLQPRKKTQASTTVSGSSNAKSKSKSSFEKPNKTEVELSLGKGRGRRGRGRARCMSTGDVEQFPVELSSKGRSNSNDKSLTGWGNENRLERKGSSPSTVPVTSSVAVVQKAVNNGSRFRSSSGDLVRNMEALSMIDSNSIEENVANSVEGTSNGEAVEELPTKVVYYGWFYSPEVSSTINSTVQLIFRECLNQVSQFERFVLTNCKDADVKDPFDYYAYKRPGKRIKPDEDIEYHTTVKFLGRSPDLQYQTLVHRFLDKTFFIRLVGIVFTPRTLGVRVKLSPAQQLIFDEKDEKAKLNVSSEITIKQIEKELNGYNIEVKMHKRKHTNCKMQPDQNGIIFKALSAVDFNSTTLATVPVTTSRAHITIAVAPKIIPKQTGDDLVDIIDLEQRPATRNSNFQQDFQIKRYGILRQFGRLANAFVFYPNYEMIVPAKFNYFA